MKKRLTKEDLAIEKALKTLLLLTAVTTITFLSGILTLIKNV